MTVYLRDMAYLRVLALRWRHALSRRESALMILASIAFFAGAIFISFEAIAYATSSVSNPVTDIILSNIPVFDVDGLFVYGTILLIVFAVLLVLTRPKRLPFALCALALLWIIRSCFVSLTHIAPFPEETTSDFGTLITRMFFSGGDLFFSGHTATPFMLALVFWRENILRYIFLAWSVFFGVVVLLGHLHYSIDVFAAFFITYSTYHLAIYFFPSPYKLFLEADS